jgi:aspartate/methionine/tyrosine aminotransferase
MFSRRPPIEGQPNALTRALAGLRAANVRVIDLTESNPTQAGIPYPEGLLTSLADVRALRYEPYPLGLPSARAAVAADHRRRGAEVDPERVVLAASTSEAYSWLFKLLCNPGEGVLVPRPSYPLFEHLTRLEGIRADTYDLEYHGAWQIDLSSVEAAPADTRAILIVSPNNPTGSFVTAAELARLIELCHGRGWAIVADEVFADYVLEAVEPVTDIATRSTALTFTLGGLSKSVGLPQLKLGWIVVGGSDDAAGEALVRLELVADAFLSVGTPVQVALPGLLRAGKAVRAAIQERISHNLTALRDAARQSRACEVLRVDGGWSAVVRVPSTRTEEQLVLDLLDCERILVHPGYFFDFPREAYIVVSLLPDEAVFASAVARVLPFVSR